LEGDDSASYVALGDATTKDTFWTGFEALDLTTCPIF